MAHSSSGDTVYDTQVKSITINVGGREKKKFLLKSRFVDHNDDGFDGYALHRNTSFIYSEFQFNTSPSQHRIHTIKNVIEGNMQLPISLALFLNIYF